MARCGGSNNHSNISGSSPAKLGEKWVKDFITRMNGNAKQI